MCVCAEFNSDTAFILQFDGLRRNSIGVYRKSKYDPSIQLNAGYFSANAFFILKQPGRFDSKPASNPNLKTLISKIACIILG